MDGLAMTGFVKIFGWRPPVGVPAFIFLSASRSPASFTLNRFSPRRLVDPVNAVGGLIACAIALMIFEVRG